MNTELKQYDKYTYLLTNVKLCYKKGLGLYVRNPDRKNKYTANFLFSKDNTNVAKALKDIIATLKGDNKNVSTFLYDGDEGNDESFSGLYSIHASKTTPILTFDSDKNKVTEKDDLFHSGCVVNVALKFFKFKHDNKLLILAEIIFVHFVEPYNNASFETDIDINKLLDMLPDASNSSQKLLSYKEDIILPSTIESDTVSEASLLLENI